MRRLAIACTVTAAAACSAGPGATSEESELSFTAEANEGNHYGNAPFELWSHGFQSGDPLPYENTCEGQPFASGTSPALEWSKGPSETKSYAIVLKDLSLIDGPNPNRAFHWAIWDIRKSFHSLPASLENAQFPEILHGAQQLSSRAPTPYAYFGPCPAWENLCSGGTVPRANDSYAFTLYALDVKELVLPAKAPSITNYVRQLDGYLQSIALAKTELYFTSDARPSSFPQLCPGVQ